MHRIAPYGLALALVLPSIVFAAEVHIDARVQYLAQTKAKSVDVFQGSVRFAEAPSAQDFARLEAQGIRFFDFGDGPVGSRTVFPAKIPFSALDALAEEPSLAAVDCGWRPHSMPPLPVSRPQVQADQVWSLSSNGTSTTTGEGVLVADIDTGVNYFHSSFFRLSGDSFAWLDVDASGDLSAGDAVDLNDNGTADPGEALRYHESAFTEQYGNDPARYDTGYDFLYHDANGSGAREFGPPTFGESDPCYGELIFVTDDTDGDGSLDVGESLLSLGDSRVRAIWNKDGNVYTRGVNLLGSELDSWGHGTQVTGILGGGWPGRHEMTGMAPGIETLHVNYDFVGEPPFLLPIEAGTAWAVAQGADIVLVEDGEWVWEYLDGSSNYEIMINEYAADPGVIFVTPAGNLSSGHMHAQFASGGGQTLRVAAGGYSTVWPSFLWTDSVALALDVTPPGGSPVSVPLDGSTLVAQGYRLYSNLSVSSRGTRRLDLRLATDPEGGDLVGDWHFAFTGPSTTLDAYYGDDLSGWTSVNSWLNGEDPFTTVTWPATADSGLVVAAYASGANGAIHGYSGRGPRLDGVPIVDIAAPGNTVYSTSPWNPMDFRPFGGTSSAGPHVAGAAALLKELFPSMTHAECQQYLRAGAAQDAFTTDPREAGAGKLRIYDTIAALLSDVTTHPRPFALELQASPNPFNPTVSLRFDLPAKGAADLRIFDLRGREVWSQPLSPGPAGERVVRWNGQDAEGRTLASGTYFAHVKQGDRVGATKLTLVK